MAEVAGESCPSVNFKQQFRDLDVRKQLRRLVSFRQHNLQQASSGKPYDLILLRNVLIYFDGESKATVMRHVSARLRSGGWLILGGAETLNDRSSEFSYVRPTIYRKR